MTISEYAKFIIKKFNKKLKIQFDRSKDNGVNRKLLDCSIAHKYGWRPKFSLDYGFDITLKSFIESRKKLNKINK